MFLLHETELLQLAQNENKVTLAVHQLKTTCLSEAWRLHIRLTVTGVLNSHGLFPLEKCGTILGTPRMTMVSFNYCRKKKLLKSEYIRDNARLAVH